MLDSAVMGGALVVRVLVSELQMFTIPQFREAMRPLLAEKPPFVVLDLGKVDTMDSSGLGAIFFTQKAIKEFGGRLALAGVGRKVAELLRLTRSAENLEIFQTVEKAAAR